MSTIYIPSALIYIYIYIYIHIWSMWIRVQHDEEFDAVYAAMRAHET